MNLRPGENIGLEMHRKVDQFIRIESGSAHLAVGASKKGMEETHEMEAGWAAFVPAGAWHDVTNTGPGDLKLYSLYSPAIHPVEVAYATKEEAVEAEKEMSREIEMGVAGADGFGA